MRYRTVPRTARDVVTRFSGNPLISIDDMPAQCSDLWNAGVIRFNDEYLLLMTVETLAGRGSIYLAHGTDGLSFSVRGEPFMDASECGPFSQYETFGIRDPRISAIDGTYYITYLAESESGKRVGLARTQDFEAVEKMHLISQPDTKSAALFPRRLDGRYAMLERPSDGGSIWLTFSDDLIHWGGSTVALTPRGGYWDSNRVGAASPPIEIEQGWLVVYYGEKDTSAGPLIRLGAAILDKDDPSQVLGRSNIPILSPREVYERIGDVGNLVFSCGVLLENDDELKVYYGASDSCICLGTCSLADVVELCLLS